MQDLPNGPGPLWDEALRVPSILRGQAVSPSRLPPGLRSPLAATNSQVEDTAGQAEPPAPPPPRAELAKRALLWGGSEGEARLQDGAGWDAMGPDSTGSAACGQSWLRRGPWPEGQGSGAAWTGPVWLHVENRCPSQYQRPV